MIEDLYKNCRWCHWFKNGQCLHDKTFRSVLTDTIYLITYLAEEGVISGAIKEGFQRQTFQQLKTNLESKLSKKEANEFMQAFYEELEIAKANWTETIDEAVTIALQSAIGEEDGAVEIIEPKEFCCKYFM